MKTLDVHTWKQNIEQTQKDIQVCKNQFETIQHAIEKVIALEGVFTGKTANAIRLFYSTCHQPLLKLADETFHRYVKTLQQMEEEIYSFESATDGYVQQQFLEGDVTNELNKLIKVADNLTEKVNFKLSDVSDIVHLPLLNSDELTEKIEEAKEMSKQTVKQLEVLDRSQADALVTVNEDIKTMKQSVEDIGNILHNGDMSVRDINLSTLSGSEAYAQLMWKVNPLPNAYYKFINILSGISPIVLMFNPKKMLPTIIHNQESKDTDINELKKTEQYQQLETQNQLTAEEEAVLSNWLLNPDKPKNVSIEDFEALTVDAKEPLIFEQERQMKGGNSDLAGTPDGLAGPTTALFTLAYYVSIDDAVVLLDPNSSPDEKAVAGLFLLPTPGKFAKPFLKHADDMGGAGNAGRKVKKVNADEITYSDKFNNSKYKNQVKTRGWTNESIADVINNPHKTGSSVNKYTGNSVTVYYKDNVHYVAIDNGTGKVIQVSDLNRKHWNFDPNFSK